MASQNPARSSSSTSLPEGTPRETGRQGSNRGFAAMSPEQQRQIASEGGRAAHAQGTAHQWSSEEARAAGRKGGEARAQKQSNAQWTGEARRPAGAATPQPKRNS